MIKILKTFNALEMVRKHWEAWQYAPNSDYEHFKLVCRLRSEIASPYVLVTADRHETPLTIVCARLEHTFISPAIGYFKPLKIPVKVLVVLHNGVLGRMDSATAVEVFRHLRSFLGSGEIDMLVFHQINEQSPLLKASILEDYKVLTVGKPVWSTHWSMALPKETGFLLKRLKSKHRSWIRSRYRKLDSAFQGKVVWRWLCQFDNLSELMARIEVVASKTYQRGLGAGFKDDEEHRQRYALFASRGQLRVELLEIEGQIKAFWIGVLYKNVFYSSETGYDPDLRAYEPGTLVFLRLVDELIREGAKKLDFGLGDAHYKQRFGDRSWRETTIRMFAPSVRGIALRTVLGVSGVIDSAGRKLARRAGVFERVKTGWRRRKAASDSIGVRK